MLKTRSMASALLSAGAAFVILYPILGVTLWVSFVATGVVAILAAAGAGFLGTPETPTHGDTRRGLRMNPVVDVALLRARFTIMLALGLAGGFLVVESYAFSEGTGRWIAFGLGIAATVAAGALLAPYAADPDRRQLIALPRSGLRLAVWQGIAAVCATIGVWQIVESLVFSNTTVRWLTFANGLGFVAMAVIGLVLHELSTERVVHALEVVEAAEPQTAERNGELAHA
jgi:hypothetical protein